MLHKKYINGNPLFFRYSLLFFYCFIFSCKPDIPAGKKIFYYNEASGISSLDPAFAKNLSIMWAVHQLYNTLVEVDSTMKIRPSLAKSWDISADHQVFTFHLRTDVFFQDDPAFPSGKGRRLTAGDVAYSFNRLIDPQTASSGAWIFNERIAVNGFTALNDSTFQLQLIKPFQPILGILSMPYCSIVAPEAVKKYGTDFRRHPCGTGPFRLQYWAEGQAMVLEKNKTYWEKDAAGYALPYLDAVKITFFDNKATEFLEFRQGRLSFINDIDPSFKDEVLTKKGTLKTTWKGKILLQKHPYLNTEYFGILMDTTQSIVKNSPLKIRAVRQAINYAINRRQLIMYMRNSIGFPAESGMVPYGLPSRNAEMVHGYSYDPAKARALLKAAGIDVQQAPVIKLLTIATYADIASFAAKDMEEIGLKVQVEVIQKSLLLQQTAQQQALFFRASWIADYPDAENYMAQYYSKNPAPPNYTRYSNPAFDRLYEYALSETNDSLRYAAYREMDQLVMEDAPVVPIWYDEVVHLVQPGITGFYPTSTNMLELRTTDLPATK